MPCTLDCLSSYGCGTPLHALEGAEIDPAMYAPFVGLRFGGGDFITVGNLSAPMMVGSSSPHDLHHAAITSMQYGMTPGTSGCGADIEIADLGGVMYRRIIKALNKTIAFGRRDEDNTVLDFGWIITDCGGNTRLVTAEGLSGKRIKGILREVEQTYEGGIMKLKVKLAGVSALFDDIRHAGTEGDDEDKVPLREALERLFKERQPTAASVSFVDKDGGDEFSFKNRDGGVNGPRGTWPMAQQNALATARTWLQGCTTDNDRGILIIYDNDSGEIVFKESSVDPSNESCSCLRSIGTYVVNGGNCSPVLKFSPTFKWPKGRVPGGGATSPGSSSGNNESDLVDVNPINDIERAGSQTSPTIGQHEWHFRHPEDHASENSESIAAHMAANNMMEGGRALGAIEADLVIFGDPKFINPVLMAENSVALIVINPFHMTTGGVEGAEWITTSNCNASLSNKNWRIKGVSHSISNGSFTTTFRLLLPTPNVDIDATDALGGNGCGSETFDNSAPMDAE